MIPHTIGFVSDWEMLVLRGRQDPSEGSSGDKWGRKIKEIKKSWWVHQDASDDTPHGRVRFGLRNVSFEGLPGPFEGALGWQVRSKNKKMKNSWRAHREVSDDTQYSMIMAILGNLVIPPWFRGGSPEKIRDSKASEAVKDSIVRRPGALSKSRWLNLVKCMPTCPATAYTSLSQPFLKNPEFFRGVLPRKNSGMTQIGAP